MNEKKLEIDGDLLRKIISGINVASSKKRNNKIQGEDKDGLVEDQKLKVKIHLKPVPLDRKNTFFQNLKKNLRRTLKTKIITI